jgi:hypothetical protein
MEGIVVKPMLDDLELPLVQEIATFDKRVLAEHKPPGMEGSLLQNMGRRPARLILWGVATGTDALKFVEKLEDKFKAGKPVPFTADITADSKIDNMVIEDLQWQELAGYPERYTYVLKVSEYIKPAAPEEGPSLDNDIQKDAKNLVGDMVKGLDIGPGFATGLERFVSPLGDLLARLKEFNKLTKG